MGHYDLDIRPIRQQSCYDPYVNWNSFKHVESVLEATNERRLAIPVHAVYFSAAFDPQLDNSNMSVFSGPH